MSDPKSQLVTALRKLAQSMDDDKLLCLGLFAMDSEGKVYDPCFSVGANTAIMLIGGLEDRKSAAVAMFRKLLEDERKPVIETPNAKAVRAFGKPGGEN